MKNKFPKFNNIRAFEQFWNDGETYSFAKNRRAYYGLCIIHNGQISYEFNDRRITASKGDLVHLPMGSDYTANFIGENISDTLINYECDIDLFGKPNVYIYKNASDLISSKYEAAKIHTILENEIKLMSILTDIIFTVTSFEKCEAADIVKSLIDSDDTFSLSLPELAEHANASISTIQRKFKSKYCISISEYKTNLRISKAKSLILSRNYSMNEISDMLNFCDCSQFYKCFKKKVGTTPKMFLKNNSVG